ncbi:hypothetical protein [Sphingomonas sp.]|uniref:hypothetical protein n=1 Tax=Sphingomonas sp. TaxID=28214 RepID=UPI003CC6306C
MKKMWFAALALGGLASAPAMAQSVPVGVYDCFGDIGKFSVVGPGTYMARNGGTGHFSFDGHTLTMTDGTSEGLSYRLVGPNWDFGLLRDNGSVSNTCPRSTTKDPRDPAHW